MDDKRLWAAWRSWAEVLGSMGIYMLFALGQVWQIRKPPLSLRGR